MRANDLSTLKKSPPRRIGSSMRRQIYTRDDGICQLCGVKTRFFKSLYDTPFDTGPVAGSVDHIIPVSKGGTDDPQNLRWSCRSCNCSRGNRA